MKKIKLFISGGTFDKEYNEITEQLFFQETHVTEMLKVGRCKAEVDVRTLMLVDSLKMTNQDRKNIVENCLQATEKSIVITHGTGTMVETAEALSSANLVDKTIVLTGAMIPFRVVGSDALFNFGVAIAFSQVLPSGVYIAMNGRYFFANKVRKNISTGIFEEIE